MFWYFLPYLSTSILGKTVMAANLTRLEKLKEKQRQLAEQISQLDAREKAEDRKKDTRRKILIGGVVLANFRRGDFPKDQLVALLDKGLTHARDRALFDFLPEDGGKPANPEKTDGDNAKSE